MASDLTQQRERVNLALRMNPGYVGTSQMLHEYMDALEAEVENEQERRKLAERQLSKAVQDLKDTLTEVERLTAERDEALIKLGTVEGVLVVLRRSILDAVALAALPTPPEEADTP